ncbi:MAG: hypothetical protein SGARI_005864 [Bacillariaceae sp.]
MAMVASSASDEYDTNRCLKMALATVGDITPHCGVSDDEKHAQELAAITELTSKLTGGMDNSKNGLALAGKEILDLWKEYEEGATNEAKLVKDMDKLEMTLQALEYEQDGKNRKSLDGFFDSTKGKWRTTIGESWGAEIESRRIMKRKTGGDVEVEDLTKKTKF